MCASPSQIGRKLPDFLRAKADDANSGKGRVPIKQLFNDLRLDYSHLQAARNLKKPLGSQFVTSAINRLNLSADDAQFVWELYEEHREYWRGRQAAPKERAVAEPQDERSFAVRLHNALSSHGYQISDLYDYGALAEIQNRLIEDRRIKGQVSEAMSFSRDVLSWTRTNFQLHTNDEHLALGSLYRLIAYHAFSISDIPAFDTALAALTERAQNSRLPWLEISARHNTNRRKYNLTGSFVTDAAIPGAERTLKLSRLFETERLSSPSLRYWQPASLVSSQQLLQVRAMTGDIDQKQLQHFQDDLNRYLEDDASSDLLATGQTALLFLAEAQSRTLQFDQCHETLSKVTAVLDRVPHLFMGLRALTYRIRGDALALEAIALDFDADMLFSAIGAYDFAEDSFKRSGNALVAERVKERKKICGNLLQTNQTELLHARFLRHLKIICN